MTLTTFAADGGMVGVSIQDNGKGMSEEVQRHIFEPFFTTKKTAGTGLGMFITYGIIKRLGGEIGINSREGVGTTVTVYLPQDAPAPQSLEN